MPNETDELETAPEGINFNSIEQKDSSNGPNNPQDAISIEDVNNNDQDGSSDDMTVTVTPLTLMMDSSLS